MATKQTLSGGRLRFEAVPAPSLSVALFSIVHCCWLSPSEPVMAAVALTEFCSRTHPGTWKGRYGKPSPTTRRIKVRRETIGGSALTQYTQLVICCVHTHKRFPVCLFLGWAHVVLHVLACIHPVHHICSAFSSDPLL